METNFKLQCATKLTKSQMKHVKGGTGTCAFIAKDVFGEGQHFIGLNVDRGTAERIARETGGRWCCDSCSDASWLN